MPVAYCTAFDALVIRGRLQPHHRVLVHSGAGAVGLAAIRICLFRGCEVRLHLMVLGMSQSCLSPFPCQALQSFRRHWHYCRAPKR